MIGLREANRAKTPISNMKMLTRSFRLLVFIAGLGAQTAHAGFWDTITGWFGESDSPYVEALEDLVRQSLGGASKQLEENPGSFNLPNALNGIETALKMTGRGETFSQYKADFLRAFEGALPGMKEIVEDYADTLNLDAAQEILKSNKGTAATDYLKQTGYDKLLAMVQKGTGSYVEKYQLNEYLESIKSSAVTGALSGFVEIPELDATEYISRNGLDLLFQQMAAQETKIRQNPELWSDAMRKVFGNQEK